MSETLRVAAAQIAPVWLNRDATLARVVETIDEAAVAGAELIAFGEALVPGYPFWVERTDGARFDDPFQKDMHAHYVDQAVCLQRGDLDSVCAAAERNAITVILGILERRPERGQSVYASAVSISASGEIAACQRKLMPTHEERLVWAQGDGHGLCTHAVGPFVVGALNCWENWMPLARHALQSQGETLHVALWPGSARLTRDITRFMALEGRSYVLSVSGLMRAEDWPEGLPHDRRLRGTMSDMPWAPGGSCIAAPDGRWLIEPTEHQSGLLIADLDIGEVRRARRNFDVAGHYARPDVLKLRVNRKAQSCVSYKD
ncbi:MAG TPA: carbon-nitrogen hydrolase family protein [Wenzhouxiangella sp.]|nr:carbon-nitrogen hydrolase family protein [Wenzhouxiangella sp.]